MSRANGTQPSADLPVLRAEEEIVGAMRGGSMVLTAAPAGSSPVSVTVTESGSPSPTALLATVAPLSFTTALKLTALGQER